MVTITSAILDEIDKEQDNLKNSLRMWTDAYEHAHDLLEVAEDHIQHIKFQLERLETKRRVLKKRKLAER
jgi:uncharacterized protein YaaN involved in tellurite resistance